MRRRTRSRGKRRMTSRRRTGGRRRATVRARRKVSPIARMARRRSRIAGDRF